MNVTSNAFDNGGLIPVKYATEAAGGENISPPVAWGGCRGDVVEFALVIVDTHPVANNWIHWFVSGIDARIFMLEEDASRNNMPKDCVEHVNSYGYIGYGGPQPPVGSGKHPYEIHVFGLDKKLSFPAQIDWQTIQDMISSHVVDEGVIVGYFER